MKSRLKILPLTLFPLIYAGGGLAEQSVPPDKAAVTGEINPSDNGKDHKPKSDDDKLKEIVEKAFEISKVEQLPLSPEQINNFQNRVDETGAAIFPSPPPKMVNRTQKVALEPGAQPVSIRLAPGYVSSIIVVDSTGEPWPITTATVGNANWFSVVKPETGAGNMLTVNAIKNHVSSNIAITLKDRDAPLLVQLTMNKYDAENKPQEADLLVSMRMNQPGPNAAPPTVGPQIHSTVSTELMSFLDGVPPQGATMVKLKDAPDGVSAWTLNNQLYVRTPFTARWPAWIQQANSSDNINVYVMPMSPQIILAANGASIAVKVIQ